MNTPGQHATQAYPAKERPDQFLVTAEGTEAVAPGAWILHGQGQSMVFELDVGLVVVAAGPGGPRTEYEAVPNAVTVDPAFPAETLASRASTVSRPEMLSAPP